MFVSSVGLTAVAIIVSKLGAIGMLVSVAPAVSALNSICARLKLVSVKLCNEDWFRCVGFVAEYALVCGVS